MKRTRILLSVTLFVLLSACGGATGLSEDQQLVAAQQTLDALNQGGAQPTQVQPPTQVPPTQFSPTQVLTTQATATQAPPTPVPPTATPSSEAGIGESVNSTRIIDLDNDGPLWDNNCNTLSQPMVDFGDGWLEDDHLFGAGLNCDLGFDLNITQSGLYEVFLLATYAPDFGLMRLSFTRGSVDDHIFNIALYDPNVRPTDEIPMGQWHFDADENNHFILAVYDKQPESTDYKFGLDYLKLVLVQPDF